jgi:hypothetical protein
MLRKMNFNLSQTHNKFDCEPAHSNGRYGMVRRVDLRIGYIITALSATPSGFNTAQNVVDKLNRSHKGAGYTYNDVYPVLRKMVAVGIVSDNGGWKLTPKGKATWAKVEKNLRGK